MKVTNGVRVIESNVNNTEVTYPDYIAQPMSPVTPPKQKRYVPLVGTLLNRANNVQDGSLASEQKYDPSTNSYITIYYQMNTKNESFIFMHRYLKARGIRNNRFHLLLYDQDLANVDPYDPNLPI